MAITHHKAGWDCFRHLGILASEAISVMLDASEIPRFSMIHYPKATLTRIAHRATAGEGVPGEATRGSLRGHVERHLTSEAMARHSLRCVGVPDTGKGTRILLIDERTPFDPEYQSALTLIGLKAVAGNQCHVAFPATFLYRDSSESVSHFYGRGFGYTKVIDPTTVTQAERIGTMGHGVDHLREYDLVVIGSLTCNPSWVRRALEAGEPSRIVLIHGEDGPPNRQEVSELQGSGAHVFVRAIHDRG